ncbi:hypothetical protein SODALDRAFT_362052 [Sodiomyces alkalinus F11]|uniref:Large ribosomal subunit protein bL33m n=1 Tax=Sodiomyces alkalinus (strain CBS 110278 / VKM F-3762 / F11) TaxID=1314773 RepID=A0A3N2PPA3_SODAK|nr:hypothetical protein SODALDRAFT_362052 [Sodiomyces alkalinus F11]ROT36264.1 hypothetical protein SODALDRAFT_362052 [Sodiomyces alkalinus F11]
MINYYIRSSGNCVVVSTAVRTVVPQRSSPHHEESSAGPFQKSSASGASIHRRPSGVAVGSIRKLRSDARTKLKAESTGGDTQKARPKSRIITVRLLSMAMTGFFYTFNRVRTASPMSMLKYDPIVDIVAPRHAAYICGEKFSSSNKSGKANDRRSGFTIRLEPPTRRDPSILRPTPIRNVPIMISTSSGVRGGLV